MLEVTLISPQEIFFEGQAHFCVFPGEAGVFEVWPLHRPMISRLRPGRVLIDGKPFPIQRGVVKVDSDIVTVIIELPE